MHPNLHHVGSEYAVPIGDESRCSSGSLPGLPNGTPESAPSCRRSAGFVCGHCGYAVPLNGGGTEHRNHCPKCLHSRHLDVSPGDRGAACGGVMEPIAVWVRKGGEWALVHRCRECGRLSSNRIAADDNAPLLVSLAVRPLASPPFPLERLEELRMP